MKSSGNRENERLSQTTFTNRQVTTLTGVTQRQLAYWRRTGLVIPTQASQGGHARYTFTDLVLLRTVRQLLDAGVSVQRLRKSISALQDYLQHETHDLHELTLVATGDVILVLKNDQAFEAVSGQQWIFPIAQLLRDSRELEPEQPQQQELFDIENTTTRVNSA